jgi:hypothetical protein
MYICLYDECIFLYKDSHIELVVPGDGVGAASLKQEAADH